MKPYLVIALMIVASAGASASPLEGSLLDAPGVGYRNMVLGKGLLMEWIRDVWVTPAGPRRAPQSIGKIRVGLEWQRGAYSTDGVLSRPVRMDLILPQE